METISGYVFNPDELRPQERRPGISAFMRVRNGEDFVEAAIRSHIDSFDEVVAVYNQCSDRTEEILYRLAAEYGPKLRPIHYLDRVYPPGSEEHARTSASSPNSLVNYYNFALAQTRYSIATKLDDDHLAMPEHMRRLADNARSARLDEVVHCFSGVNLAYGNDGRIGLPASDLLCGNGDHWFFKVGNDTFFEHDRRFEKLRLPGRRRRFCGFAYWHLKYLKPSSGFSNYELEQNPRSRYHRRWQRIGSSDVIDLGAARRDVVPSFGDLVLAPFVEKRRLLLDRAREFPRFFTQPTVQDALDATSPEWRRYI